MRFLDKYEKMLALFAGDYSSQSYSLLQGLIAGDEDLLRYSYLKNSNPSWLDVYLGGIVTNIDRGESGRQNVSYALIYIFQLLENDVKLKPSQYFKIVEVINGHLRIDDKLERGKCCRILSNLPNEYIVKGIEYIKYCIERAFESGQQYPYSSDHIFIIVGKISQEYHNEAFEIAELILQLKVENEWPNIKSKLDGYLFNRFLEKYYISLAEKDFERSIQLLLDLLEEKLGQVPTPYYGSMFIKNMPNLRHMSNNPVIGMIETATAILSNCFIVNENKAGELFDYITSKNASVFNFIALEAVRRTNESVIAKEKMNSIFAKIISDNHLDVFEDKINDLLVDRFEDISEENKTAFIAYIESIEIDDSWRAHIIADFRKNDGVEPTKHDFEKILAGYKARKLYPVKKCFPDLYEKYRNESGKVDAQLKPIFSGAQAYSPASESPISIDEMNAKTFSEIIDFLENPDKWPDVKTNHPFVKPVEGVRAVFRNVIKKRAEEFANLSIEDIYRIPKDYRNIYLQELVYNNDFDWSGINNPYRFVEMSKRIISENEKFSENEKHSDLQLLIRIFEKITELDDGKSVLPLDERNVRELFDIINSCLRLGYGTDAKYYQNLNEKQDIVFDGINSLHGKAAELAVILAVRYKNIDKDHYADSEIAKSFNKILDYLLSQIINDITILHIFVTYFLHLCWLNETWVRNNVQTIFKDNGEVSQQILKEYLTSAQCSELSYKIAKEYYYDFLNDNKNPEGDNTSYYINHLSRAYWQGWIGITDVEGLEDCFNLIQWDEFARRLENGFDYINNNDDGEWTVGVKERVKQYWEYRLRKLDDSTDSVKEAIELVQWAKDSPLGFETTLDLVKQTLRFIPAKPINPDAYWILGTILEGVIRYFDDDRSGTLKVLIELVKRRAYGDDVEPIKDILERIVKSDAPDLPIGLAIELADMCGRAKPNEYLEIYKKLSDKI